MSENAWQEVNERSTQHPGTMVGTVTWGLGLMRQQLLGSKGLLLCKYLGPGLSDLSFYTKIPNF